MYKCPIFQVADLIGKRWTIVVIQEVALNGRKGFNTIHNRMRKISPKVLSKRLKELEEKGILEKKVFTDKAPFRTSYKLTKKGEDLQDIVSNLKKWYMRYSDKILGCDRKECVTCPLY